VTVSEPTDLNDSIDVLMGERANAPIRGGSDDFEDTVF
jgi:hypothetical protein